MPYRNSSETWSQGQRVIRLTNVITCDHLFVYTCNLSRGIHLPKPMMRITYSLYFLKNYKFPPISGKFMNSTLFPQKFALLGLFTLFCIPYFDHDAFMHHALLFTMYWRPLNHSVFCQIEH